MVLSSTPPLVYTLLPLARYARIFGIAPLHFFGATAGALTPPVFPVGGTCGSVWPRHDWQNADQTSREDLALTIKDAEFDVAKQVGYWPAPMWIESEEHVFPRDFYRENSFHISEVRGRGKGLSLEYDKVISPGVRETVLLGTPQITYQDLDADGFFETARIVLAVTGIADVCEAKVYFQNTAAMQEWEIRPARSATLTGGVLTMFFDSWLLINPDLQAAYPDGDAFTALDVGTTANFVTAVDVYREYVDTTQRSVQFAWETAGDACGLCLGVGCEACADTTQDGCFSIRDAKEGIVAPFPASYDGTAGTWNMASYAVCSAPDKVRFWYYAGDRSQEFLKGLTCDPLPEEWARVIAWLATSRLERPPCGCTRTKNKYEELRVDLTFSGNDSSYFSTEDVLECPFGTRRGEVMAWRKIKRMFGPRVHTATV